MPQEPRCLQVSLNDVDASFIDIDYGTLALAGVLFFLGGVYLSELGLIRLNGSMGFVCTNTLMETSRLKPRFHIGK